MVLEATLDIFLLVQDLNTEEDAGIDQLDPEESTFQASFNKLGASEPAARDPVASIPDAKLYLSQQLAVTSDRHPGKVSRWAGCIARKWGICSHLHYPFIAGKINGTPSAAEHPIVLIVHGKQLVRD
jgi:hypothetical protein